MLIQRPLFSRIQRIVPGAGRHLHHSGQNLLAEVHPGKNGSPGVKDLDHAAFADAPRLRILRMHPQRLAPLNFRRPAHAAVIVLAVQAGARLAGEQMQRPARRLLPLPGRLLLIPPRVAGTLAIAKPGDGFGKKFDLAGRRRERIALRVGAKIRQENLRFLRRAVFQHPLPPEFIKRRQRDPLFPRARPRRFVDLPQPLPGVAPLAKALAAAQPLGKVAEDGVIIARFAHRRDLRAHGDHKTVVTAAADIFPLQRSGDRQNDIGKFGLRGPELFMNDHRFRPPPGFTQAVNILMMMKRVAAGPVDEADVGIAQMLAVKLVCLARMQQHIGKARHRNHLVYRVLSGGKARAGKGLTRRPRQIGAGVAKPQAAARRTDLPQQRSERHRRPVGLLALARPLNRPGDIDHRALAGHLARQRGNPLRLNTGYRRRPLRRFCDAIALPHQVGAIGRETHGMAGDKTAVVEGFINQHITERQQQRGIGSRTNRKPLGALHGAQVIAHRADIDKARPLRLHLFQPVFQHMVVGAAAVDLRITQRQAAECDKQLAFARQLGKVGVLAVQRAQRPENMRQDALARRAAVGVGAGGIAAEALEEAVQLTLRVVKTAGAGPAVGAAENRLIAAARFDRIQFAGQ